MRVYGDGEVRTFQSQGRRGGEVRETLEQDGLGRVLLIDGGGSLRKALIDAEIATIAEENEWEGIVVYGCVREVDELEDMNLGIQALASIPVGATNQGIGELDVPVNFGGVSFLPEDYIYADSTGIILSPEPLNIDLAFLTSNLSLFYLKCRRCWKI